MNRYEQIKNCTKNELVVLLASLDGGGEEPWTAWFGHKYCDNCESEMAYVKYFEKELECSWCELHHGVCKYFPDKKKGVFVEDMIELWLDEEQT